MQLTKFIVCFIIFKIVGLGTFCLPLGKVEILVGVIKKDMCILAVERFFQ